MKCINIYTSDLSNSTSGKTSIWLTCASLLSTHQPTFFSSQSYPPTISTMESIRPSNLSASDRTLRTITSLNFIPAFALLIPYGVSVHHAIPTIGLIPMFLSSVFGLLCLIVNFRWHWLRLCVDASLAMYLFGMLLPYWITAGTSYVPRSSIMLGTYGTVPLMVNLYARPPSSLSLSLLLVFLLSRCPRVRTINTLTRCCEQTAASTSSSSSASSFQASA